MAIRTVIVSKYVRTLVLLPEDKVFFEDDGRVSVFRAGSRIAAYTADGWSYYGPMDVPDED